MSESSRGGTNDSESDAHTRKEEEEQYYKDKWYLHKGRVKCTRAMLSRPCDAD